MNSLKIGGETMPKLHITFILTGLIAIISNLVLAEEITLTTYYPAPYGAYRDLTVSGRQAIGDLDGNGVVDAGDLAVDQLGNPIAESLTIAGRVGIGTRNLLIPLTVTQNVEGTLASFFRTDETGVRIESFGAVATGNAYASINTIGANPLKFGIAGTNIVTITGDGLGISRSGWPVTGTFPATALDIRNARSVVPNLGGIYVSTESTSVSSAIIAASSANEYIFMGQAEQDDHGGQGVLNGDAVIGQVGGNEKLVFSTEDEGISTTVRARMVINGYGNVGIGTTTPGTPLLGGERLDVIGNAMFRNSSTSHNMVLIQGSDPNAGIEIRSGSSNGTPYIDFSNNSAFTPPYWQSNSVDFDARLVLMGDNELRLLGADFTIQGSFAKSFVIDHPTKPGYELVHACVEGPEVAVFYRGEAQLTNGKVKLKLPDYFEALTKAKGRTVQLTAKGTEPFLLSYTDIVNGEFTVYGTKSEGEFSWEVKANRADIEPLKVERKKK
jgi:hypothetical protein